MPDHVARVGAKLGHTSLIRLIPAAPPERVVP